MRRVCCRSSEEDPDRRRSREGSNRAEPLAQGEPVQDATGYPGNRTRNHRRCWMLRDTLLSCAFLALVGSCRGSRGSVATNCARRAGIVYIGPPADILPDFIPVLGQLDDIYLVALGLLRLLNRSGEAKLRQHWDGPEDIVGILERVSEVATRYLPAPVRNAVRNWIEARA